MVVLAHQPEFVLLIIYGGMRFDMTIMNMFINIDQYYNFVGSMISGGTIIIIFMV